LTSFHDSAERRRRFCGDGTGNHLAWDGQAPAVADHCTHDAWLHELATIGDNADRLRHLQRRHADLIAHGDRGERTIGELRWIPHDARALAGEIG
jgi:hypothetical protein